MGLRQSSIHSVQRGLIPPFSHPSFFGIPPLFSGKNLELAFFKIIQWNDFVWQKCEYFLSILFVALSHHNLPHLFNLTVWVVNTPELFVPFYKSHIPPNKKTCYTHHCMKFAGIQAFSDPYFPVFKKNLVIYHNSVQIWENRVQKKPVHVYIL